VQKKKKKKYNLEPQVDPQISIPESGVSGSSTDTALIISFSKRKWVCYALRKPYTSNWFLVGGDWINLCFYIRVRTVEEYHFLIYPKKHNNSHFDSEIEHIFCVKTEKSRSQMTWKRVSPGQLQLGRILGEGDPFSGAESFLVTDHVTGYHCSLKRLFQKLSTTKPIWTTSRESQFWVL
jgi:hypothetical protein